MTNRERLNSEIDNFRHMILGMLADEALDAGDAELAWGYLWLRDTGKWPAWVDRYGGWDWIGETGITADSHAMPGEVGVQIPNFRDKRMPDGSIPAYRRSESSALEAAARAAAKAFMPKE